MERQSNFTKRDILVFLGCVVFLLANLGAIGAGGRRLAKEIICLSNLKEWGTCFSMYTSDYNGFFGPNGSAKTHKWFNYLRPYYSPGETVWGVGKPVKMNRLLLCPSASSKFWSDQFPNGIMPSTQSAFISWGVFGPYLGGTTFQVWGACSSYGANGWAAIPLTPPEKMDPRFWKTINIPNGNIVPLLADCATIGGKPITEGDINPPQYDGNWYGPPLAMPGTAASIARFVLNRHTEGSNYLFMDLSARKVGLKENWTLKWHQTFNTSNCWTKAGGVEPDDWPEWMRDFKDY